LNTIKTFFLVFLGDKNTENYLLQMMLSGRAYAEKKFKNSYFRGWYVLPEAK
jgi:hypothetical protein